MFARPLALSKTSTEEGRTRTSVMDEDGSGFDNLSSLNLLPTLACDYVLFDSNEIDYFSQTRRICCAVRARMHCKHTATGTYAMTQEFT